MPICLLKMYGDKLKMPSKEKTNNSKCSLNSPISNNNKKAMPDWFTHVLKKKEKNSIIN